MKLLKLDLLAVGPFTGRSLDLSAGDHGLHVVVGPNEAGKSSALRAVAALLYGFGHRTAGEDAVHKTGDVRVGGTLRHSDGTELAGVRRRGNDRTLRDAADEKKPLPDDALSRFLGTVDRAAFDGFFGLGHGALRDGADDLLRSDGQVGQALFSAGAGGKPLRVALDRYESQATALYKKQGSAQVLPRALAEFKDAKAAVEAASLRPETWTAERDARDGAEAEATRVRAELAAVAAERAAADRRRRAVPLLAERAVLLAEHAAVADAARLPADFAARRAAADRDRVAHGRAADAARRTLAGIVTDLDAVAVPEPVLARADAVADLHSRLAGYRRAVADAPALRLNLAAKLEAVGRAVVDLRPGAPVPTDADALLAAADGLRLGTARRARIEQLAGDFGQLAERRTAAARGAADAAAEQARVAAEASTLPEPTDVSALTAAVRVATLAGDVDQELAAARAAAVAAADRAEAARRSLPGVGPSVAGVERLPLPSAASVEAAERDLSTAAADHVRRQADADRATDRVADLDRQLGTLRLAGPVPTEDELAGARAHRDALWADVRRPGVDAGPYEAAVRHADDVADGLRRESARVAQLGQLTFDRREAGGALTVAGGHLEAAVAARSTAEERWRNLWAPAGVDPRSPAEMRAWLATHRELCRHAEAARTAAAAVAALAERVASHRSAVATALGAETDGPLAPVLERGRAVVDGARVAAEQRRRLTDAGRDAAAAARRWADLVVAADAAVADWHRDWSAAVAGLGLPVGAGPAEARSTVRRCDELAAAADEVRQLRDQLSTAEAEAGRFAADAAALAADVAPTLAGATPADTAAALRLAVAAAQQAATRRQGLQRQRADAERAVQSADGAVTAAAADAAELCRLAGCEPDGLPEVERRSALRDELDGSLRQRTRELLVLSSGEPVESLAASEDEPALAARLAELDRRWSALDARRGELDQQIGRSRATLDAWTGTDAAAAAADVAQQKLAAARAAANQYLRLRLASGVLRQGIERHRQRKEGPLLGRASGLFAGLTLGSFAGLDVDLSDGDRPVLKAVRPGTGGRLTVDQMSDGSRDQLYLALRLAALEDFVGRNEPVPLVVDDVLVHFDDARSRAALAALAALSARTQVILFTHHDRVADLATEAAGDVAQIHRLG